jgi:hypothetical protein
MDRNKIEYWPADLQAVFAVIGELITDKPLAPGMASSIPNTRGSIVEGHRVTINYVSGKRIGPRTGRYVVTIFGPSVNASWQFRPFELEKLSRSVTKAIGRPSELNDGGSGFGVVRGSVWSAGANLTYRANSKADEVDPPPHMAGTHYDDQAERYPGQAPEDFPRGTGLGHVNLDRPPDDELSSDPEVNIVPTDAKGG